MIEKGPEALSISQVYWEVSKLISKFLVKSEVRFWFLVEVKLERALRC